MLQIPERIRLNDAREFRSPCCAELLYFLGFIAPLHDRSAVKKNVAAAPLNCRRQQP
jgi:hypothetical protein